MSPRRRWIGVGPVAAGLFVIAGLVPSAASPVASGEGIGEVSAPAVATAGAVRIRPTTSGDLVSVYEVSALSTFTANTVQDAAASVGASTTLTTGFSVGMTAVRRGDAYVQRATGPSGLWQFPMGVTALDVAVLPAVMGDRVASTVGQGMVVMGQTTAELRGAQAGDVVDLVAADGSIVSFTVGLVATDAEVGGTEIVMSLEQVAAIAPVTLSRVLVYGSFDRTALDVALNARGVYDGERLAGARLRVRRSWSPADPDSVIGLARTKQLLGEFDYVLTSSGVSIDADWRATQVVRVDFADIHIRTNCNVAIIDDLQAALTEVAQQGLAGAIDLANTNSYGGCFMARFNRVTGNLGFLSRHSWGQPIDMNTLTNAQGAVPKMNCDVVRIFRKHGFAWGGNFLSSDGMHFEWVGEPRDQLPYPSKYCPNLPNGSVQTVIAAAVSAHATRAAFFSDDGWR